MRAEGEAICFPADTVRGARVRVLGALGYGVPNVPLQVIAEGLFAASAAPTDDTGATQVTAVSVAASASTRRSPCGSCSWISPSCRWT